MTVRPLLHSAVLSLLLPCFVWSQQKPVSPAVEKAAALEEEGNFIGATSVLGTALALQISSPYPEIRKQLEFELDRLDRIRQDYPLTRQRLFEVLKSSVQGLTDREFSRWVDEGRFDSRTIDSVQYFMGSSRSNLFFRYPELAARRISPPDWSQFEQSTINAISSIKKAVLERNAPYVLPKSFDNTVSLSVNADAVPAGQIIRAWLPIPRAFPHQISFNLVSSSSPVKTLGDPESPIRSAFLEQPAQKGKPTDFSVEYTYTTFGIWFNLNPTLSQPYNTADPVYKQFTSEDPHVVFTEAMKQRSTEIGGNEQNPIVKAKKFYDWIADSIKYSYAIEYSTIRNIGDYCLTKKYGDCGQEALLFITLCRLNGIPARWESGWFTMPGGKTIHDWTEIYLPPYGWVPVDPYMGIFAMQYFKGSEEQRKEIRDFYFGGLDQYRMAANSDHCQELVPAKQSMRSDNVDFQRGEVEVGNANIYFDKYSYSLKVQELQK